MLIKIKIDDDEVESTVEELKDYVGEATASKAALHALKNFAKYHKLYNKEKFKREKTESILVELQELVKQRDRLNESISILLGSSDK